jgi:CheY-like chemotaxis protein
LHILKEQSCEARVLPEVRRESVVGTQMDGQPLVLVVEDEEPLHDVIGDALRDGGFDLMTIGSAEEAVTLLKTAVTKYRSLVTDIDLKGEMDGWEVARQARLIDPTFPVVYMTGAAGADWPVHGVPGSVLLQKPFAPAQLVTAISQLLNVGTPLPPTAPIT